MEWKKLIPGSLREQHKLLVIKVPNFLFAFILLLVFTSDSMCWFLIGSGWEE